MQRSALFQAAIIFLHNAKGNNARVAEEGVKNLLRCSQVIRNDQDLSSTRMAIVLESITTSYSVKLDPDMCLTDKTSGSMRTPADLSTPLRSEKDASCTDISQHHGSTQPDDMFLSLLSKGSNAALSATSVPVDSFDPSLPFKYQRQPYPTHQTQQFTQQSTATQLSLDSLPLFSRTDQWVDQKQQDAHMDALIWDLMAVPTPVLDPLNNTQPLAWPEGHSHQSQTQAHPLTIQQRTDYTFSDLACLSSEVPLTNMPNSVLWEDWDTFLKSNVGQ